MTTDASDELERLIASWRGWIERRDAISAADVDELEAHLRDQVDHLVEAGLSEEEGFLVAVRRLGGVDELSREYAREHSERLWKQLVLSDGDERNPRGTAGPAGPAGADAGPNARPNAGASTGTGGTATRTGNAGAEASTQAGPRARSLQMALGLGVAAGLAVKAPELMGLDVDPTWYLRNVPLIVLGFLAAYFAWRRRLGIGALATVAGTFAAMAVALNLFPFAPDGTTQAFAAPVAATELLACAHAVVVLWFAVGLAYTGGEWRSDRSRMDFVRFSGEWFVYYVLIALGGGALSALTIAVFESIGVEVAQFIAAWVLPCGAAGAVLVAAWLVEAKQRVIENIAPVLTKVFTPLFTLMMLALIVAALMQWNLVDGSRELLIAFDLVLVVAVALLVYSISARDPLLPPGWFDRLQLVMLVSALAVDVIVLGAMIGRTGEYGFSANKTASLGLNLILLANLTWAAWLQLGFVRRRRGFAALEHWQMSYLPVYLAWALVVVVAFPPIFGFA